MAWHARASGSAGHRWVPCPGSIQLAEELKKKGLIPPRASTEDADRGTAAHFLGEECLGNQMEPEEFTGKRIFVGKSGNVKFIPIERGVEKNRTFLVDDEMIQAVDYYVQHVRRVAEDIAPSLVELEVKLDLKHISPLLGGTCDARVSQEFGELHLIDYKNGRTPVHAKENVQLMIYALGSDVMRHIEPQRVILTIVQPHCVEVETIQQWETTPKRIREWAGDVMIPAVRKIEAGSTERHAGPKQCHWCDAAAHCPEALAQAKALAVAEFEEVAIESSTDADRAVARMPDENFAKLLNSHEMIDKIMGAVKKRAFLDLKQGRELSGWKLVKKTTKRKYVEDARQILLDNGVPEEACIVKKESLVPFTKLEKSGYKAAVAKAVEKPEGSLTLAKESDRRKAVCPNVDAKDEFDKEEEKK